MSASPSPEVHDDPEADRYVITVDGVPAGFSQYVRRGRRIFFVHTEVDAAFEGQGLGSVLARAALDAEQAAGTPVVPLCPFVRHFIDRHPEYAESVDRELLARIDGE